MDADFCVIDTETTGGKAAFSRITDVAVFRYRNGEVVEKFQSLINPQTPIPAWITMLTGIDDDMVRNAPTFAEIAPALRNILEKGIFTAHNAGFDYSFIQEEFRRLGELFESPRCCTLKLARHVYSDLPSKSLGNICEHLLIDIWDRHRASGDAEATVTVFKYMLKQVERDYGISTWDDLESFMNMGALHLPKGIRHRDVALLPEQPGMYIFKNAEGEVVLSGQVTNVRRRVKTFFKQSNQSEKSNRLRETVHQISYNF